MADQNKKKPAEDVEETTTEATTAEDTTAEEVTAETEKTESNESVEVEETEAENSVENEEAETENSAPEKKESKFFGKKKDKEKDKLKEQVDELNDRLMRQMAEFENYRKRTEKEKQAMFETGAKSVIEKLLPTVDNFERGLAAIPEEEAESKFVEGMQMIYKQLMAELEKLEVKPIEALGKEFDPNLHNAVMHIDDENFGENIVAQELQKGYTYRDNVVRHSMVQVAN